ncbi:ImuA family protein [Arachidicoccus terrestris]|uniref:ImuA family protein n=1 Tax=Arachidicoccus terrestris TaxID=2875539 RepID=UPI001CC81983|nr:Error-prone repair protein ImuA [Arachidicoccus terrestris]UAY56710.1 Error-prone repair protein ImuA [Arachidicoccus terrestris]
MQVQKKGTIEKLRREILDLQGPGIRQNSEQTNIPLGPILYHMPGGAFPTGVIHEFISPSLPSAAATTGFISALIHSLMQNNKPCLWVSTRPLAFPSGLKIFGIEPDRFIFIDTKKDREALWTIEEGLKCSSLCAVIGEINALDFKQSRRLQLAVENSRVTGFINRLFPRNIQPTACVSRWQILPVKSQLPDNLPGIGFPRWKVDLLKIRNGRTGSWQIEWSDNKLCIEDNTLHPIISPYYQMASA